MTDSQNTQSKEDIKNGQDAQPENKATETPAEGEKKETSETTVGDQFGTSQKKSEKPETVPFEVFESLKKEMKELKKAVEEKAKSNRPIDQDDIDALAEKFNVDSTFLNELAQAIDKKNADKYGKVIEELQSSTREQQIDNAFKKGLKVALEKLPEYKSIINKDVIKTLSLDPKNSNKTISQLIKETYGNVSVGKKTLESSTGNTRGDNTSVDVDRARKDPSYFSEIKKDPAKLKEYNASLLKHLRL